MNRFFRIMLGKAGVHAEDCYKGGFIGVDFNFGIDLTTELNKAEDWRQFNKALIPIYLKNHPEKTKIAAGLSCGFTWTVTKGIEIGDVVICPKGEGKYYVGEISSEYQYVPGELLPHRRRVIWWKEILDKSQFSVDLRNSMGSIGTVSNISKYATELTAVLEGKSAPTLIATDENVEDASVFALEKHLEDFLVENWSSTELSKSYDIYEEGGELVGQQFPTDTGPIDILAISKDRKELLVIELKKGRVSDVVVGQIQRYMGFVTTELAEENQKVKGIIIGLEDDLKLKRALSVTQNIDFYKYQVSFKLFKG